MGLLDIFKSHKASVNGNSIGVITGYSVGSGSVGTFTEDSALQISTVYRCTSVLAGALASLPKHLYQKNEKTRERVFDNPVLDGITKTPNEWLNSQCFWSYILRSAILKGNGYAIIEYSFGGKLRLIPRSTCSGTRLVLNPDGTYTKFYEFDGKSIPASSVIHITSDFTNDFGDGVGIVSKYANETFQHAKTVEQYSKKVFEKGTSVNGVLSTGGALSKQSRTELEKQIKEKNTGSEGAGNILLLEGNGRFDSIQLSPDDTKWLTSRRFDVEEVCRWFGIPSFMVNSNDQSSYNANEQSLQTFCQFTLLPWVQRIEQEINKKLFPHGDYYIEMAFDGLLRPTTLQRVQSYVASTGRPFRTVNEIRALENLPPVVGGDVLALGSGTTLANQSPTTPDTQGNA